MNYNNAAFGSSTRWFYGQVIDIIFVPLYVGYFLKSWPIIGDSYSNGFPIFNIADSSLFIAVALIPLNQSRFFNESQPVAAPSWSKPLATSRCRC